MSRLEDLPRVTGKVLDQLQAGPALKQRILQAAAESAPSAGRNITPLRRNLPLICGIAAALLIAFVGISYTRQATQSGHSTFITAAHAESSPVFLQRFLSEGTAE